MIRMCFLLCILLFDRVNGLHIGNLNGNNDHGFWFEQNILKTVGKWDFSYHTEERWGNNYKTFWYFEHWAILQYNFTDYFTKTLKLDPHFFKAFAIGPGFAQTWSILKNTHGKIHWVLANRPTLVALLTFEWKAWTLKQRMATEYLDFQEKHLIKFWHYRHRFFLYSPWKVTCLKINPFCSDELFFRAKKSRTVDGNRVTLSGFFYENRFKVGFYFEPLSFVKSALWWQVRTIKIYTANRPNWINAYFFGTSIDLTF